VTLTVHPRCPRCGTTWPVQARDGLQVTLCTACGTPMGIFAGTVAKGRRRRLLVAPGPDGPTLAWRVRGLRGAHWPRVGQPVAVGFEVLDDRDGAVRAVFGQAHCTGAGPDASRGDAVEAGIALSLPVAVLLVAGVQLVAPLTWALGSAAGCVAAGALAASRWLRCRVQPEPPTRAWIRERLGPVARIAHMEHRLTALRAEQRQRRAQMTRLRALEAELDAVAQGDPTKADTVRRAIAVLRTVQQRLDRVVAAYERNLEMARVECDALQIVDTLPDDLGVRLLVQQEELDTLEQEARRMQDRLAALREVDRLLH